MSTIDWKVRFGICTDQNQPFETLVERWQLFESVQIVDSLLRNQQTTFDGRYYQLDGAYVRPAPVQKPRPPLTLGAHKTRMLRICAEQTPMMERIATDVLPRLRNG